MNRVLIRNLSAGSQTNICGWVTELQADERIVVSDHSGDITVTIPGEDDESSLEVGQSVEIIGQVKSDPPHRMVAQDITTYEQSHGATGNGSFPAIDTFSSTATIRDGIYRTLREKLREYGGTEITTPNLVGVTMEGDSEPVGTELFNVDYFDKQAYLAQSPQIFKQICATHGLERVFEISPFYRAESSGQHLAEGTTVDYEAAFSTVTDVMDVCETLVSNSVENIIQHYSQELEKIGSDVSVDFVDRPFPRIEYEEAIEVMNETAGLNITFGDDLPIEGEQAFGASMGNCYFITDWPADVKSFYIMSNNDGTSKSFDLMHPELELASGGQREHRYPHIKAGLERQGIQRQNFKPYEDFFKKGIPPHAGFGMGIDRLFKVITGVEDITKSVLFPRTRNRLSP